MQTGTSKKRSCAYCGGIDLTREHLIPQAYLNRTGGASEFIVNVKAGAADKIVSTEPVISDVSRTCNNGVLSNLDAYFLTLFDRYFGHVVRSGELIRFDFKFDELLRWLLKMGFNMGRARAWDGIENLAACTEYVRFGQPLPNNVTVLLQAVTPGLIPGPKRAALSPEIFTVNAMRIPVVLNNFSFALHVGIHCYQFYVLFHSPRISNSERRIE